MANRVGFTIVCFTIFLSMLFLFNVKAVSTNIQNITNDTHVIGAIVDTMTSRAGKEASVAMEIAINDFNAKSGRNMTLYTKNSKGNLVQAIHDATNLIDTRKVEAILGLQTLEEAISVGEIGVEAQIPTFSLLDSLPQWALDSLPFLVQASPSQFAQMEAFVAILESCGWNRFTFIYEDINSASTQVIPYIMGVIKDSGIEMNNIVRLSPFSSLVEELDKINTEQSRVFLVHTSLETGIRLFQNAKNMGMMEKGYVWITTNLITDRLHTINSSTFSMMEGVVGIGSYFPNTGSQFHDFITKFQNKFKIEHPEEEYTTPGIFAVQAYDATSIVALALSKMNMSRQNLLDTVSSTSLDGITGEVQFINRKSAASHIFQIINVIGKYYRQLGFWSEGLGFSEVISDTASYGTSLQNLGHIFWPGRPLDTPIGRAIPTNANPLRVGVPMMSVFKKFVDVEYDHKNHNFTFTGYSIELFKETVKRLPYYLPYEFYPFNGTYDSLVKQVYLKNFDMVVGDVSVVSRRYQYVEFTHPYTQIGLVMVVPATSYHGQWLLVKPFTFGMWGLIIVVNIYTGLVVWVIEREQHSRELEGSVFKKIGVLLPIAITKMSLISGDKLESNLTRITTVAWLLTALIIGQCYTASLTSMLTVKRLVPRVTNYETLKNANAFVGYGRGSHVASYLEDVLGFKHENLKSFTTPEEYAHALRSREIAAVFLEAPFTKLFLAKYCNSFVTAGTTFGDGGFAFVLPKGSPMLPDVTEALLNVSEIGTLQDIEQKMLGSENCVDLDSGGDESGSLGLNSLWSLFILTGGTSTAALVIYAIFRVPNRCRIYDRILDTIISDARNNCLYRRKRLFGNFGNVNSRVEPNAVEMTRI